MENTGKISQPKTSYASIAIQLPANNPYLEILIPADGDCLYTAIFVGYLLPTLNKRQEFIARLQNLIGNSTEVLPMIRDAKNLNDCIIRGANSINEFIRPEFKAYIIAFRKYMQLDDKKWGGALEIIKIKDKLNITIQEFVDNPSGMGGYVYSNATGQAHLNNPICVLHTHPNKKEIVQDDNDKLMLQAKIQSLPAKANPQHFRLLSTIPIPPAQLNSNLNKKLPEKQTSQSKKVNQVVDDIDPIYRRHDSLAWLIQGDSECGAAYFSDNKLFLTTNKSEQEIIFALIKDHLNEITKEIYEFSEKSKDLLTDELNPKITEFILQTLQCIAKLISKADKKIYLLGDTSHLNDGENSHLENFIRSLFKITFSIIDTYLGEKFFNYIMSLNFDEHFLQAVDKIKKDLTDEILANSAKYKVRNKKDKFQDSLRGRSLQTKQEMIKTIEFMFANIEEWLYPHAELDKARAFSIEFTEVLRKGNVQYLGYISSLIKSRSDNGRLYGAKKKKDQHAEMKILQQIINDNYILDNNGNIDQQRIKALRSQYIGISKKCCLNCDCAIEAVNNVIKKYTGVDNFILMRTVEGSGGKFPAAVPDFLKDCREFEEEFLVLRKTRSLLNAFQEKETHVDASRQKQRGSKSKKGSKRQENNNNSYSKEEHIYSNEFIPIYHGASRLKHNNGKTWQHYQSFSKSDAKMPNELRQISEILSNYPIESKSLDETTMQICFLKSAEDSFDVRKKVAKILNDLNFNIDKVTLSENEQYYVLTVKAANKKWGDFLESAIMQRQSIQCNFEGDNSHGLKNSRNTKS